MTELVAIVMASGFSRRMGRNKLLLPLGRETVISHVLKIIESVDYAGTIVVSQYPEVLALAEKQGFFAVENHSSQEGKSSSIRSGLLLLKDLQKAGRLPQRAGAVFFTADQIFLSREFLLRLKEEFLRRPKSMVFPAYGGKPGSPGAFPEERFAELMELAGEEGGMAIARRYPEQLILVAAESELEGYDFDTWEEWERALALWRNRQ